MNCPCTAKRVIVLVKIVLRIQASPYINEITRLTKKGQCYWALVKLWEYLTDIFFINSLTSKPTSNRTSFFLFFGDRNIHPIS